MSRSQFVSGLMRLHSWRIIQGFFRVYRDKTLAIDEIC